MLTAARIHTHSVALAHTHTHTHTKCTQMFLCAGHMEQLSTCAYTPHYLTTHTHTHTHIQKRTQVFLRAGHMAQLDKLRTDKLHSAAVTIQRHCMGWLARSRFQSAKRAAVMLQCAARGLAARKALMGLRMQKAAITIQVCICVSVFLCEVLYCSHTSLQSRYALCEALFVL